MGKALNFGDFLKYSGTFIETGSHAGQGIRAALAAGFSHIKSVEAERSFYEACAALFSDTPGIELFHGLSTELLPLMLAGVDAPAVFWLDAHPSGPGTGGHDDLMQNGGASTFTQDNILTKEIEIILSHRNDHVILIDDQYGENAENIRYRRTLTKANPNYHFQFFDRQEGPTFYKDKVLACIPL